MDTRSLPGNLDASRSGTSYSRRATAGARERYLFCRTLVFLIIIQLRSGYCALVITVSYTLGLGA